MCEGGSEIILFVKSMWISKGASQSAGPGRRTKQEMERTGTEVRQEDPARTGEEELREDLVGACGTLQRVHISFQVKRENIKTVHDFPMEKLLRIYLASIIKQHQSKLPAGSCCKVSDLCFSKCQCHKKSKEAWDGAMETR